MSGSADPIPLRSKLAAGSVLGRGIDAARGRGPSDEQLKALERSVLGCLGATGIVAGTSKIAQAAHPHAAGASAWLSAGSAKLVAVLVATAATGSGAGLVWYKIHPAPHRDATASAPARATSMVAPTRPLPEEVPPNIPAPALAPSASPPARPVAKPRVSAKTPSPIPSELLHEPSDGEIALLERANRALTMSPALALSLIEEHEHRFPSSPMDQERELIAVTALVRLGRVADARQLAEHFAQRHPGSAYVGRIQSILEPRR